jgi:hypothetical protein
MVRLASDMWVRPAVARWHEDSPGNELLIVEAPLIGGRLLSLVQPLDDSVEPLLSSETTLFVLPVPTLEIKEALRHKRSASKAQDPSERDASVSVLDTLAEEINAAARSLGITAPADKGYDPDTYAEVYLNMMRHRHRERLNIAEVFSVDRRGELPGKQISASAADVEAAYAQAEQMSADVRERRLTRWFA